VKYPHRLRINCEQWKVIFVDEMTWPEGLRGPGPGHEYVGICDNSTKEIRILRGQPRLDTIEVFCHEILHAIEYSYGIEIPHGIIQLVDRKIAEVVWTNFLSPWIRRQAARNAEYNRSRSSRHRQAHK
jgi:hypothetical protein